MKALPGLAIALVFVNAALLALWLQPDVATPAPHGPAAMPPAAADTAPLTATAAAATAARTTADIAPAPVPVESASAATALVFGTVRTATGDWVLRGHLSLQGDAPAAAAPSGPITGGAFALPGVRPGKYVLRSRIEDQLPLAVAVDVRAPHTRVDLQLDSAWMLDVHAVTPDGAPLVAAVQERLQQRGAQRWIRGLTALAFTSPLAGDLPPSNGRDVAGGVGAFRGGDLWRPDSPMHEHAVGLLVLPPQRPVHVALLLRNVLLAQQGATPGQHELTFTLSVDDVLARAGTVYARLVDGDGAPVTGARCNVNDAMQSGGGVVTGADGRVTLHCVKPGLLDVDVVHPTLRATPTRVVVAPGVETDLGDVVLRPGTSVDFVIEGGDAATVVRATPLDAPSRPDWRPGVVTQIAERPSSTLRLAAGRHGVYATQHDLCALLEVDTSVLRQQPIRIVLQRGAPLIVKWRMGEGAGRVDVRSSRGTVVFEFELAGDQQLTTPVPPGTYDVAFVRNGFPTERRSFTVGASGAVLHLP